MALSSGGPVTVAVGGPVASTSLFLAETLVSDPSQHLQADAEDPISVASMDPVDISFYNITCSVKLGINKGKKTILHGVSGEFRAGQLTAIMGPSGAGKSTLLNALTGFATRGVTGRVRTGSSVFELDQASTSPADLRKRSSYIHQDERLNPLFTVSELMKFAADIKLGNSLSEDLKLSVIKEVLVKLGLSGTEDTKSANLSGGQRKRLSIATELLDGPRIIYLDEPTAGLDSLTSMQCMTMLKSLAYDGRTIVCTIHQPSATIYSMIDQVYVLADGMCIYNGPSENTIPYFASIGLHCPMYHNPADFIIEIASGEYGEFNGVLAATCSQIANRSISKQPQPLENTRPSLLCDKITALVKRPPELYKFSILFKRCLLQQYRDWTSTHLKMLLNFLMGILAGLFYDFNGNDASRTIANMGYLAVSIVYVCYTSIMPAVLKFPLELLVLRKEYFNNWYKMKTYYIATLMISVPLQIWYSILYSVPSYILSGQPAEWPRFLMFTLALVSVSLLADAIGNVIGTCVNAVNGTFIGGVVTCAMILFMGTLVMFQDMNSFMVMLSDVSSLKHAYEAMVLAVYSYGRTKLDCPTDETYCYLMHPSQVMKLFGVVEGNYWRDVIILLVEIVVVRVLVYCTLKRYMKIMTR